MLPVLLVNGAARALLVALIREIRSQRTKHQSMTVINVSTVYSIYLGTTERHIQEPICPWESPRATLDNSWLPNLLCGMPELPWLYPEQK